MPNIIGGKYKRTKLEVPNKLVRPTSALKREAIFSILESYSIQHSIEIYKNKSIIYTVFTTHHRAEVVCQNKFSHFPIFFS